MTAPFTRRLVPFPVMPAFGDDDPAHASDAEFYAQLGINIGTIVGAGTTNSALLQKVLDLGATSVRWGPVWANTEEYDGDRIYDWTNGATSTLAFFRDNAPDVRQYLVSAYGPPWKSQGTLTVAAGGAAGDFVVQVTDPAGILAGFSYGRDLVIVSGSGSGRQLGNRHGYGGTLIDSVTSTSIKLASALTATLTAGTKLTVNRLKWPSISSDTAGYDDENVLGYLAYCRALAQLGDSYGLMGWVEGQNEPPWSDEPWPVGRNRYYDNGPDLNAADPDPGMVPILRGMLRMKDLPPHWRLANGATHKTNGRNVLSATWPANAGGDVVTDDQLRDAMTAQARHPYSLFSPVAALWDPAVTLNTGGGGNPRFEQLDPTSSSNFNRAPFQQQTYRNAGRPAPLLVASEWGLPTTPDGGANDALQAKYLVAGTLVRWGCRVLPMPYTLQTSGGYTLLNADGSPRRGFTALQRLMQHVRGFGRGADGMARMPGLLAWRFDDPVRPLAVGVYGQAGAALFVWQEPVRTTQYAVSPAVAARPIEVWVPQGTVTVQRVSDGQAVAATRTGNVLTVPITDDPVMVKVTGP